MLKYVQKLLSHTHVNINTCRHVDMKHSAISIIGGMIQHQQQCDMKVGKLQAYNKDSIQVQREKMMMGMMLK